VRVRVLREAERLGDLKDEDASVMAVCSYSRGIGVIYNKMSGRRSNVQLIP
jgi:hypothetical protein